MMGLFGLSAFSMEESEQWNGSEWIISGQRVFD